MQKEEEEGKEEEEEELKMKNHHVPESPTGAEYVVPPVLLDEGPVSGESNAERERETLS